MKANCKALKLSLMISIVSLVLVVILSILLLTVYNDNKIVEILLNICIGLFGSGFVALLLSIPAYRTSKTKVLDEYYQEVWNIMKVLGEIDYLYVYFNEKLLISYINKLIHKNFVKKIINDENVIDEEEVLCKEKLIEDYTKKYPEIVEKFPVENREKYVNGYVERKIEEIREEIKKVCVLYVKLSKESTSELSLILGDIEFFKGKKPYKKIYNETYRVLYDTLDLVKEESFHFQLFLEGKGNEAIVLEKILKLQQKIFSKNIKKDENVRFVIINNEIFNKMQINMENFRADIYNIKPEVQKLHSVKEFMEFVKDNEKEDE